MAASSLPAAVTPGELAGAPGVREVLQWFTREKQWVNDLHLQLCRIPAPTFLEQPRAEWVASQFRSFGWHAGIDRAGNVLASLDPYPEGPLLAVTAHLDTVLAPRTKEDIAVDPEGNLRGPGVSDNGAGLAGLLALARAITLSPDYRETGDGMWRRLILIANVGEEGEGNLLGMRFLCKQPEVGGRMRAFVVLDGAAVDHITMQALGSRRFEITISGMGGHSWSDFGIGNPVHALSRAMANFVDQKPLDPRSNPRVAVNVGIIEGGSGVNAIPASARAKVDIRSESNERMEELVVQLHNAVVRAEDVENQRAIAAKVTAKIKEIGNRPAAKMPPDAPLLAAVRAVDAHLGIRARFDCASTDANIPMSLGIPAISIGAGGQGGGAHTLAEWYSPEGRDLGLKRVALLASMLLRDPAA